MRLCIQLLFVLVCGLISIGSLRAELPTPIMTGLVTPESACVGADGSIYVSNIGERDKTGDGTIAKLGPNGQTTFTTGLNDPKGLATYQKNLFVTDQTHILRVDESGKADVFVGVNAFPIKPLFLNDIAVDAESGTLYVTDSGDRQGKGGAIYRITQKKEVELLVSNTNMPELQSPNGVQMDGASHLIFGDMLTGTLYRFKLSTRQVEKITNGLGRIDGIVWDHYGRLIVSAIKEAQVWVFPTLNSKPILMASGFKSAADIGLGKDGNSILVPDMQAGMLYQLPITIPGAEVNQQPLAVDSVPAFANIQWEGWSPETDSGKPNQFRPIVLTHAGDGSNRIFLATEHGVIYVFENKDDVKTAKVFADLRDRVVYNDKQNEEGFLGLAFHPQFKDNGEVFVFYTTKHEKLTNIVSRFKVNKQHPELLDPTSEQVLIKYQKPFWNHDGGSLCFGPDGYLYIVHGDGGSGNDPFDNAQNLGTWLGKILRIDINTHDQGQNYAVPKDNPFVGQSGALPEIWAYGFRNVWRMHFDRQTGELWAADVGQNLWEEINIVKRGGNYGWNRREGRHPFGAKGEAAQDKFSEPIWEYHHDLGKSITGGLVYRGKNVPALQGKYLYADYITGKVWALTYDAQQSRVVANQPIADRNLPILSFGEDETGEQYYLTHSVSGQGIYRFRAMPSSK